MHASHANELPGTDNMKWGYAIAGAIAVGFALFIQVGFDGLDEEGVANLPAIAAVPYALAGKLGITFPLALLGMGLILRDVLTNQRTRYESPREKAKAKPPRKSNGPVAGDDGLEVGEPIPEETTTSNGKNREGKKIPALTRGFDGRGAGGAPGGPVGDSNPVSSQPDNGRMVLSSEKYLRKRGENF